MGAAAMTGVVGSAIGAGASLIGGASSTAMQNQANKEIAQMNNAFNEKMFDKQIAYNKEMYQTQLGDQWKFYDDQKANAWKLYEDNKAYQTEMWNKQNEYNDPSAQRARLEAAGLNPYMMMNGGSAGVAGSVSGTQGSAPSAGSPSAQGVQPPTATPYSADYSGVMQGLGHAIDTIMSHSDRNVKNAQAENLRIEGKYIASKALAQILKDRTEAKTKEARLALDKLVASFDNDLKASQVAVNNENIAQTRAQTKLLVTENLIREQELSFLPKSQKMQLALATADIAFKRSQGYLSNVKAQHEIKQIAETVVRTEQSKQQYEYDKKTFNMRVSTVEATMKRAINNTGPDNLFQGFSKSIDNAIGRGDGSVYTPGWLW